MEDLRMVTVKWRLEYQVSHPLKKNQKRRLQVEVLIQEEEFYKMDGVYKSIKEFDEVMIWFLCHHVGLGDLRIPQIQMVWIYRTTRFGLRRAERATILRCLALPSQTPGGSLFPDGVKHVAESGQISASRMSMWYPLDSMLTTTEIALKLVSEFQLSTLAVSAVKGYHSLLWGHNKW